MQRAHGSCPLHALSLLGATGLFLLACGGAPRVPSSAEDEGAKTPRSETNAIDPSLEMPPGREVSFERELREVERIRALSSKRAVRGQTIGGDDLVEHLKRTFQRELPPEVIEAEGEILIALGVVPFDFDYEASMLELMRSDLAGLYDPRLRTMFLREELEEETARATLLHELVHALQDQHYDLSQLSEYVPDSTDRNSALSCLAEGDATSAMFDGMIGAVDLDSAEQIFSTMQIAGEAGQEGDSTPAIVRRSVLAPYLDGLHFVHQLRRRGGFAEVDRAWKDLPQTTEQILHLDKYDSREPAHVVPLPPPPPTASGGGEWQTFLHDVWGEQSVRILLEEWVPPKTAKQSARGWGGDRIAIFRRGEERALAWHFSSDDEESAKTLSSALRRAPVSTSSTGEDFFCGTREERGAYAVTRRGIHTVLVAGPYSRTKGAGTKDKACEQARAWSAEILDRGRASQP